LVVVTLLARTLGVTFGLLYDDDDVRRWDLALVLSLSLLIGVRFWRRRRDESMSGRFDEVAAPLAFAGAVIAFTGVVAPVNPTKPGEAPCRGALVKGAPVVATSLTGGVNARLEPSRSGEFVGRFAGDCSIGFDAFCIADPLPDLVFSDTWIETRWLRVHRNRAVKHGLSRALLTGEPGKDWFVSGGVVHGQVNSNQLEELDNRHCGLDSIGLPGKVTALSATPDPKKHRQLVVTAEAERARNMGFAVWLERAPTAPYRRISGGKKFTGTWEYSNDAASLPANTTTQAVLLAIPCLAPNAPAGTGSAATLTFELSQTGQVRQLLVPYPQLPDRTRLERTACEAPS